MTAFLILLTLLAISIYLLAYGIQKSSRNASSHPAQSDRDAYWRHIQGRRHQFTSSLRR